MYSFGADRENIYILFICMNRAENGVLLFAENLAGSNHLALPAENMRIQR